MKVVLLRQLNPQYSLLTNQLLFGTRLAEKAPLGIGWLIRLIAIARFAVTNEY